MGSHLWLTGYFIGQVVPVVRSVIEEGSQPLESRLGIGVFRAELLLENLQSVNP